MRRATWVLTAVTAMLAACAGASGKPQEEPPLPKPKPSPTVAAHASTEPSASSAPKPTPPPAEIAAWTDEGAIAELAKDCRWDPDGCLAKLQASVHQGGYNEVWQECRASSALTCAAVAGQNCNLDMCTHTDEKCFPECSDTCQSCADACTASCDACKAPCADDGCRLECAQTCGVCRQACVKDLDRCTSAHCAEVADQCYNDRRAAWDKGTCARVCPKVVECVQKCPELEPPSEPPYFFNEPFYNGCGSGCFRRLGKGCPTDLDQVCMGNPRYRLPTNDPE